jgi:ATP-dependent helicase/DNAse subunit B
MSSVFLYSSQNLYSSDSLFWKSISELIKHNLPPLCIVPSTDYKKGIIQFLSTHFSVTQFPTIVTLDELFLESVGQPLNQKPETQYMSLQSVLESVSTPTLDPIKNTPGFRRHFFGFLDIAYKQLFSQRDFINSGGNKDLVTDLWALKTALEKVQSITQPTWFTYFRKELPHFEQLKKLVTGKPVFMIGFSDLRPYQRSLFEPILNSAMSCSILDTSDFFHTLLREKDVDFQLVSDSNETSKQTPSFYKTGPQELEWILKDIKHKIDNGAESAHFAIVSESSFSDSSIKQANRLADLYHLTIDSDRPLSLLQSPICQSAIHCCSITLNGFTRPEVKALFLCPYLSSFKYKGQDIILDIGLIQDIVVNASILETPRQWINQLGTMENTLKKLDPESPKIETIKQHILFFTVFSEQLLAIRSAQSTEQFSEKLTETLNCFQFKESFLKQNETNMHSSITAYYAFKDALNRFTLDYKLLFNYFQIDHGIKQFKQYLSSIFYQIPRAASNGIQLCTLEQSIARSIPHIYVINATEGTWPNVPKLSIFIHAGIQKRVPNYYPKTCRSNLKQLLTRATSTCDSLTITYSDSRDGNKLPASVFQEFSRETFEQDTPFITAPNRNIHHQIDMQLFEGSLLEQTLKEGALSESSRFKIDELREDHSFSATELDTYNKCPKQHFYAYILKITDQREWVDDIKGSLWGTLVHDIFYQFFMLLKTKDLAYDPNQFADLSTTQSQLLCATAEQVFKNYSQDSIYWDIKKEALFGTISKPGLLQLFMKDEQENPLAGMPDTFEKSFDITLDQSVKLKGKVDMVLKLSNGAASVVDFKTGSTLPTIADIKERRSLQLPVYMLALNQEGYRVDSSYFYHMKDQKKFGKKMMTVSKQAKDDGLKTGRARPFAFTESFFDELKVYIASLKKMISEGKFDTVPYDELSHMTSKRAATCKYCAYSDACRYEGRYS